MINLERVLIIGEAGGNHNGDIVLAKKLVDMAREAQCDAVKFQSYNPDNIKTRLTPLAEYQKRDGDKSSYELSKRIMLTEEMHRELWKYCRSVGIRFISTAFDREHVDLLNDLAVEYFKIGSGEITNIPLIKYTASKKKPIILSTGMSTMEEIKHAVEIIKNGGCEQLILLHCRSNYPAQFEELNLRAIITLRNYFNLTVGYSDHSLGIEASIAAVALGAQVIEKHITLDRTLPGPDQKVSLEPEELKELVRSIRNVEKSLGDGEKKPTVSEEKMKLVARKSLVFDHDLREGSVISESDIAVKKPGDGIESRKIDSILGKTLICDVKKDQQVSWRHLKK